MEVGQSSSPPAKCPMCGRVGHNPNQCPWLYSRCRYLSCNGIRKLLVSDQEATLGKKIFTCSRLGCEYFQWFETAVTMAKKPPFSEGCFGCGNKNHALESCPWNETGCSETNCDGRRHMLICKNEHNYRIPYLKCKLCGKFQWLSDVIGQPQKEELREIFDSRCSEYFSKLNIN